MYRIDKDGQGAGGLMCPPGHPNLFYVAKMYTGPRGRKVIGWSSIDSVLDDPDASEGVKRTVRRILDSAKLTCSEDWLRQVYGYFRHSYAPESLTRNVSESISDRSDSLPPERHLAVLCVREYFPDHQPRLDLITDPGKGYGSWPCTKCGAKVQYEARIDAHAVYDTRKAECPNGGTHTID